MDRTTFDDLKRLARRHFCDEGLRRIDRCLDLLSEDQIWFQPNTVSNSVGMLLSHLAGNIRQYLISGLGQTPDTRQRDEEFQVKPGLAKAQVRDRLALTLDEAMRTLDALEPASVRKTYHIQGFTLTSLEVIVHVMEHFSYHLGQIAYITKLLTDAQTGFYDGVDLTATNKPD